MDKRVLLLVALVGCVVVDDDKTPTGNTGEDTDVIDTDLPPTGDTGVVDPDADADGFPASVDCDDGDATINPDAEELCDGIDNNCDLAVDDAAAATLDGTNYATVDDAIAASAAGSVIELCPGTWSMGGLALGDGDELTLSGVAGSADTTLMEASSGTLATVSGSGMLTLEGVTVTGSATVPALMVEDMAMLTVMDSAISGNTGSGIDISGAGGLTVLVEGSTIDGNDAGAGNGGGINAFNGFDLTIVDSTISNNNGYLGGGLYAGAVFVAATVDLQGATIDGNTAEAGAGMVASNVTVTGDGASFVSNNVANAGGGGLGLYRSPVSGLLVSGNSALQGGGVAALFDPLLAGSPLQNDLTGVIIDSNTADLGAGIYVVGREELYVDGYCAVTLNTATAGGGAYVEQLGTLGSDGADWGDAYGGENSPDDVYAGGNSYVDYGAGAVFTCDSFGCL